MSVSQVQESFEEELPYIPTTLPQERSVAVPMVPVRERGGVLVRSVQRPRASAAPAPAPAAPSAAAPPPAAADKLRIKLPRRPRASPSPAPTSTRERTRSGSGSGNGHSNGNAESGERQRPPYFHLQGLLFLFSRKQLGRYLLT